MKKCLLAIAALTFSFSLTACNSSTASHKTEETADVTAENADRVPVTLTKAVDGDTIKVKYKGKEETVRYLLVDTPETKKPNSCVQPYGKDASERNKELVSSGKLELEFDKGDRTDKYNRLLAYVYVDGQSVQEKLLKEGLARVAYIYPPNTKYVEQYKEVEKSAQSKQLAIWSKSGYVTDKGFNGCVSAKAKTVQKTNPKQSTPQKPANSPSEKSASDSAPATGSTEVFANCTELRKKYPNGVPSSHPAYQSKMDRDHDNYACER
ncbi:thermonuclease family protein [Bacillus sonorensis]|uniref:thermonuclease family protein n=1 Tax=Bacillus sonorensis TaxID=119858 RepID=UPI00098A796A|nr:thermonuclease family protein [Bacillus sonorensis]